MALRRRPILAALAATLIPSGIWAVARGLADHVDVGLRTRAHPKRRAHQRLVIVNEHGDAHDRSTPTGNLAFTWTPPVGPGPTASRASCERATTGLPNCRPSGSSRGIARTRPLRNPMTYVRMLWPFAARISQKSPIAAAGPCDVRSREKTAAVLTPAASSRKTDVPSRLKTPPVARPVKTVRCVPPSKTGYRGRNVVAYSR